jgi:hypothetical protein
MELEDLSGNFLYVVYKYYEDGYLSSSDKEQLLESEKSVENLRLFDDEKQTDVGLKIEAIFQDEGMVYLYQERIWYQDYLQKVSEKKTLSYVSRRDVSSYISYICDRSQSDGVYLLSLEEYNKGLLIAINHWDMLRHYFRKYGKKILNSRFQLDKPSFFSRIFRES